MLSELQRAALASVREMWPTHAIVLVGATALRIHGRIARATEDVDLAIALDMEDYPGPIARHPDWAAAPDKPQRWAYRGSVEVDLLPAGPALLRQGYIEWRPGFRMNLSGFELLFGPDPQVADAQHDIKLASICQVALLKLVAFLDRPAERRRDLGDLAQLFASYLNEHEDVDLDRMLEATEEAVPFDVTIPYLLARDLVALRGAENIAQRFVDALEGAQAWMLSDMRRLGPATLHDEVRFEEAWRAFKLGLER